MPYRRRHGKQWQVIHEHLRQGVGDIDDGDEHDDSIGVPAAVDITHPADLHVHAVSIAPELSEVPVNILA